MLEEAKILEKEEKEENLKIGYLMNGNGQLIQGWVGCLFCISGNAEKFPGTQKDTNVRMIVKRSKNHLKGRKNMVI